MPAEHRYLSARVARNEDARLLTGRALFVDDVQLPGMLHVAFVRSEHAHGRITNVDVSAAKRHTGVHAVYTAADLGSFLKPGPVLVTPPPIPNLIFHGCTQLPLAQDKVRHVGEAIAMVVADSRYVAEDAVRDVVVDIDPIDAVVDLEKGLAAGAPLDPRAPRVERRGARRAAERRLRVSQDEGRHDRQAAVPLRSWCFGADRKQGRGCRVERQVRRDDDLGHHPGPDSDPERACAHARVARIAGERDRPVCRRRLRAEDHDVLPRRASAAVGGDAAEAAAEVDGGPPGEFLRHDAGARTGA